ncbi:glycosyltransferase [Cellulomonas sp. SLBN-39]|uniref:glycosyltransferase family 2 protein n=1 Tax=Cellulomonas sp. SLBN-39 TaxID=2768446 RepID=UPI001151C3EE|nr:glycosyltransferase [Cellulomonas sp. SLBN-39]TQL03067.1 glycosyltransferase involved in cell wall biosynthesis [Cellulomonas sp. SLBN-39]
MTQLAPLAPQHGAGTPAVATPVLTVVVPAYNSDAYLDRCLDTLVGVGPAVEVVVVDDGSTDGTAALAQRYAERHPGVRVVSKANGGHGSAVNTGLEHATGTWFKVVDSDDWVDVDAFAELVRTLLAFVEGGQDVDLVVSNFVYEKTGKRTKTVVRFGSALPRRTVTTWSGTRRFRRGRYMLMHAMVYRTQLLRDVGLRLPEHTFYVDNLYAFVPLARVRTLYYLDVDLYRYFIGREDQSVQEAVMLRRLDQQLRVNRAMLRHLHDTPVTDRRLRRYLLHHLEIVCAVSSVLLLRSGTPQDLAARDALWAELRAEDWWLYRRVRWSAVGALSNLPGRPGRHVSLLAYRLAQRVVGFS